MIPSAADRDFDYVTVTTYRTNDFAVVIKGFVVLIKQIVFIFYTLLWIITVRIGS